MIVNKDFQTRYLIAQHSIQPIRGHVRKFLSANMYFFYYVSPGDFAKMAHDMSPNLATLPALNQVCKQWCYISSYAVIPSLMVVKLCIFYASSAIFQQTKALCSHDQDTILNSRANAITKHKDI